MRRIYTVFALRGVWDSGSTVSLDCEQRSSVE
jgi:hypothetical protein